MNAGVRTTSARGSPSTPAEASIGRWPFGGGRGQGPGFTPPGPGFCVGLESNLAWRGSGWPTKFSWLSNEAGGTLVAEVERVKPDGVSLPTLQASPNLEGCLEVDAIARFPGDDRVQAGMLQDGRVPIAVARERLLGCP